MPPTFKRFDNMFLLGVNPKTNDTQHRSKISPELNRFPAGAQSGGFSVPPRATVAPSLFTTIVSHFYLWYQQHGHTQSLIKEVSLHCSLSKQLGASLS